MTGWVERGPNAPLGRWSQFISATLRTTPWTQDVRPMKDITRLPVSLHVHSQEETLVRPPIGLFGEPCTSGEAGACICTGVLTLTAQKQGLHWAGDSSLTPPVPDLGHAGCSCLLWGLPLIMWCRLQCAQFKDPERELGLHNQFCC